MLFLQHDCFRNLAGKTFTVVWTCTKKTREVKGNKRVSKRAVKGIKEGRRRQKKRWIYCVSKDLRENLGGGEVHKSTDWRKLTKKTDPVQTFWPTYLNFTYSILYARLTFMKLCNMHHKL